MWPGVLWWAMHEDMIYSFRKMILFVWQKGFEDSWVNMFVSNPHQTFLNFFFLISNVKIIEKLLKRRKKVLNCWKKCFDQLSGARSSQKLVEIINRRQLCQFFKAFSFHLTLAPDHEPHRWALWVAQWILHWELWISFAWLFQLHPGLSCVSSWSNMQLLLRQTWGKMK